MRRISEAELSRVRDQFFLRGEAVADWARQHGFSSAAVYQVLSGRCQASRGESHRIAIALGLKPTKPADSEQLEATM
jgi:gp16 family phage-associated protein